MVKKKGTKRYNVKKAVAAKQPSITDSKTLETIAPAFGSLHQPVFMKVCRLCETKDGPFLNIFDSDKVTMRKIEAVMPFRIEENDDLPHKICFRCSAKLEELYEFIQKCIRTQDHLQTVLGKKGPFLKVKHRELWEEKLNQSNISNDDICDALIKKAMEGIKDIPLNPTPLEDDCHLKNNLFKILNANNKHDSDSQKMDGSILKVNDKKNTSLKETKKDDYTVLKNNNSNNETINTPVTRSLRSCTETKSQDSENKIMKFKEASKQDKKSKKTDVNNIEDKNSKEKEILQTNTFSLNETTPKPEPVFNIMDHVSTIKVNGVGVLFQCRLCNRNFLKKQVVMSHACAKNGASKVEGPKPVIQPEPPKVSTVKYITTKQVGVKKSDENVKKTVDDKPIDLDVDDDAPLVIKKPKPRIGPASKVRRNNDADGPASTPQVADISFVNTSLPEPVIEFPKLPSLNSRYKLMAGPNNTYTLVEEKIDNSSETQPQSQSNMEKNKYIKPLEKLAIEQTENRPYPVGLFKTLPHNSSITGPLHREPVAFTTPAMKKQSYTIVQTGNPSKLLISSKPKPIAEEVPKKRLRKTKHEIKKDESNKQPFSVTLEDTAPPRDAGFFTFINVDPLLQPSYVLPTDNIIQESQISTSTNVSKQNMEQDSDLKYTCNMCSEKFSREKKLLAHIQSHYSKMDEEDQVRTEKTGRKRRK